MKYIQPGWGYFEEYRGNILGDFKRAVEPIPITIIETRRNGQDVYVRLPNGKRGLVLPGALEKPAV